MGPETWSRVIGASAWEHVVKGAEAHMADDPTLRRPAAEQIAATVLTKAAEVGFKVPAVAPRVTDDGARVLWPRGESTVPVLTARGLERHWAAKGHGFVLLRVPQLCRALAGSMLPHLQAILSAYEEQCKSEKVPPLPEHANWCAFVGGEHEIPHPGGLLTQLADLSPERRHPIRASASPGARTLIAEKGGDTR